MRAAEYFIISVSVYASSVVLDSISESLLQMSAEPNKTWLNFSKLSVYDYVHTVTRFGERTASLGADQQQHWDQLQVNFKMGHSLDMGENKTLADSQRREMELTTSVRDALPFVFIFIVLFCSSTFKCVFEFLMPFPFFLLLKAVKIL